MSIKWTTAECEIIVANPQLDAKELSALLPGRSHEATLQKRIRMGIHYFGKKWTAEETTYLLEHRYDSIEEIAAALSRPVESVVQKRVEVGARRVANCLGCGVVIPKRNQYVCCPDCVKPQSVYNRSATGRYSMYKHAAKRRGLTFNLSLSEFTSFRNTACVYCSDVVDGIGIDRADNTTGYELANCVSCCMTCNRMKLDHTTKSWMAHMQKILKNGQQNAAN